MPINKIKVKNKCLNNRKINENVISRSIINNSICFYYYVLLKKENWEPFILNEAKLLQITNQKYYYILRFISF